MNTSPLCTDPGCNNPAHVVTTATVAKKLCITERTLWRYCDAEVISRPKLQVGTSYLWTHAQVAEAEAALLERVQRGVTAAAGFRAAQLLAIQYGSIDHDLTVRELTERLELQNEQIYWFTRESSVRLYGCKMESCGKKGRSLLFRKEAVAKFLTAFLTYYGAPAPVEQVAKV
jgi:hypothetical protein